MGSEKYILKIKQQFCLWSIFYQMDFMRDNIVSIVLVTVDNQYPLFLKNLPAEQQIKEKGDDQIIAGINPSMSLSLLLKIQIIKVIGYVNNMF